MSETENQSPLTRPGPTNPSPVEKLGSILSSKSNRTKLIPAWFKLGFTLWLAIWIPCYWQHFGPQNFLWFCDLGNLVIGLALWRESRLLFSWQAVSVLLVQLAMIVDILGRLMLGFHPIGGTEYFWDTVHYPLHIRLLSLFHVVSPFLLLWAVWRLGYDRRAFGLQVVTTWVILPVTFLLTSPKVDINWVFGPFDAPQHRVAPGLYLALCLVMYPLVLHLPTHLLLAWWRGAKHKQA